MMKNDSGVMINFVRNYNNKISWLFPLAAMLFCVIIIVFMQCVEYLVYIYFIDTPYSVDWHQIIRDIILASLLIIVACWSLWGCRYQINGDRLIVKEGLLGLNMDIPISTIKEVSYTPIKKRGKKAIHLRVGDNTYILKANTHSEELYRDLSQLITLYNEEKSHIKFHKQQKQ